jgi:hypothetical protein
MWLEIAGVLSAGAAAAVLAMRVSESRPKAASMKMPERIDARLEEILRPKQAVLELREPVVGGVVSEPKVSEAELISQEGEKLSDPQSREANEASVAEDFILQGGLETVDKPMMEGDGVLHWVEEPGAVYRHAKSYF